MEIEYKYHKHGKPIPKGWEATMALMGTHHGHHAILIKRILPPSNKKVVKHKKRIKMRVTEEMKLAPQPYHSERNRHE